jgi:hypothetical protein
MKGVEILGEAPGEIRVGNGSGAVIVAGATLRRTHEKIVSPVRIANEHQGPKPGRPTKAAKAAKGAKPTKLRLLPDRPSDR